MTASFVAYPNPDPDQVEAIAAENPYNPFLTQGYASALRERGDLVWAWIGGGRSEGLGCLGYEHTGRWRRTLSIPSIAGFGLDMAPWDALLRFARSRKITSLSLGTYASEGIAIPRLPGETLRIQRTEFRLDLGCWEGKECMGSNHRRNVRRALKASVSLGRTREPEAVSTHIQLMGQSLERRRNRGEDANLTVTATEVQALIRSGVAELFQARINDDVVSSILILRSVRGAYYHSAGTSCEGRSCGASHWLIATVADLLKREGCVRFNLGGAPPEDQGLARFKMDFGATPVLLEAVTTRMADGLFNKASRAVASIAIWVGPAVWAWSAGME